MAVGIFGDPCVSRHTAIIYDRGGKTKMTQIFDMSAVSWQRLDSQKSQAQISVTGKACAPQVSQFKSIESKRHELVLFRGKDRVWEGPIVQTRSNSTSFTITANDISEYLGGTALSKDWPNIGGLMTTRLQNIITYELTNDYVVTTTDGVKTINRWENITAPANILQFLEIRGGLTTTSSATTAFQMTVFDHLVALARSIGVSWTVVGRKLVIWDGTAHPLGQTRTLTEKDFAGDFSVIGDGASFANVAHVTSTTQPTDGSAAPNGHAANDMSYYGPWEQVIPTTTEAGNTTPTQGELNSQAKTGISTLYPVPVKLDTTGGSLRLGRGLSIQDLVAGVNVPARASRNLRSIYQMQRLSKLDVSETSSGETIGVTLTAIGGQVSVT